MSIDEVSRRDFLAQLTALSQTGKLPSADLPDASARFGNGAIELAIAGTHDCLWSYRTSNWEHRFGPPVFSIDGQPITATLTNIHQVATPNRLNNGTTEHLYRGSFSGDARLSLVMQFRVAEDNPIVRFRYLLESDGAHTLTKPAGTDAITYLRVDTRDLPQLTEIRLSNFIELWHCYSLEKNPIPQRDVDAEARVMGPIVTASNRAHSMVVAYEHGSQHPDAFLEFAVGPDRSLTLRAAKGNYLSGQVLDPNDRYETVWFETGAVEGDESALASAFRAFVLKRQTLNLASRTPRIYYNTWNFQERNKWWNAKPYTDSMSPDRILREIDIAHQLGIEVYVLDAGWYGLTGDWNVNLERFPSGLEAVQARLKQHGMELGLWFGATTADIRSDAARNYRDCVTSWKAEERKPTPGFTSDVNYPMCLVSRYGDAFLDRLIRLHREIGVTYFKWDGIEQHACDSPHHGHGTSSNAAEERADSHAFQLVREMCRIADKLVGACPDAVIDFDITERSRAVGLSFLSSGRFFHVNNGPYYHSYDIPNHKEEANWNLMFYPGPARTWFCRSPIKLNEWIPPNLLLTHYFPDDPRSSQEVNLASMVLGQNGIWGDLLGISQSGIEYIGGIVAQYKKVRDAAAESDPVITGTPSGSPEIYEHLSAHSGRGLVCIFAMAPGRYSYLTRNKAASPSSVSGDVQVNRDASGRARISCSFEKPGAKILFFGAD